MSRNINLTFPVADWIFGTTDLDRGLWETLFNGYSTRYVRKDMKRKVQGPELVPALSRETALMALVYRGDRTIDGIVVLRGDEPLDDRSASMAYSWVGMDWGFVGPAARQLSFCWATGIVSRRSSNCSPGSSPANSTTNGNSTYPIPMPSSSGWNRCAVGRGAC